MAIVGANRHRAQTANRELKQHLDTLAPVRVHAPVLQLPDVFLEEPPSSIPLVLQESFDRLWQAWGYPKSYSFQETRQGQIYWQKELQSPRAPLGATSV
jgi:hypothetical protein